MFLIIILALVICLLPFVILVFFTHYGLGNDFTKQDMRIFWASARKKNRSRIKRNRIKQINYR